MTEFILAPIYILRGWWIFKKLQWMKNPDKQLYCKDFDLRFNYIENRVLSAVGEEQLIYVSYEMVGKYLNIV